jgi:hypothetical protein
MLILEIVIKVHITLNVVLVNYALYCIGYINSEVMDPINTYYESRLSIAVTEIGKKPVIQNVLSVFA